MPEVTVGDTVFVAETDPFNPDADKEVRAAIVVANGEGDYASSPVVRVLSPNGTDTTYQVAEGDYWASYSDAVNGVDSDDESAANDGVNDDDDNADTVDPNRTATPAKTAAKRAPRRQ